MTENRPDDPSALPNADRAGSSASRTTRPQYLVGENGAGGPRPRVKMLETAGDLTPAGASFTPPTPAPLPERRSGLYLFLSLTAAVISLVFVVLLAAKL